MEGNFCPHSCSLSARKFQARLQNWMGGGPPCNNFKDNQLTSMDRVTSQIEKHFHLQSVYKRSRHLYDVEKIKHEQRLLEIYRRKPSISLETLDTRVDESFCNSAQASQQRIDKDISDWGRRYHDDMLDSEMHNPETEALRTTDYPEPGGYGVARRGKPIRAPNLAKMSGRTQVQGSQTFYRSQDRFNNFSFSPIRGHTNLDFNLASPRPVKAHQQDVPKSSPAMDQIDSVRVGEIADSNKFNRSVYRCLFDYSKSNRYINLTRKPREEAPQAAPLSLEKMSTSMEVCRANRSPGQAQFYLSTTKAVPSTLAGLLTPQNQYFYRTLAQRKAEDDYTTIKRRSDMMDKKIGELSKRKAVVDSRDQICDYKFFNRQSYRQK